MEIKIQDEKYGLIVYSESFWTGKKEIFVQNKLLGKVTKNKFYLMQENETVYFYIKGNALTGVELAVEKRTHTIIPKTKWYEHLLAWSIVLVNIVFGNIPAMLAVFPVVGGAIGGFVSALFACLCLNMIKKQNNILFKVLIALGFHIASLLSCFVLAFWIIGALA